MLKRCRRSHLLVLWGFLVLLGSFTNTSWAAEFNFSVLPEIPANQLAQNSSYFDLLMPPNHKQELTIWLKNDTAQPVLVTATTHSAFTNDNGVVEYGGSDVKKINDPTLRFDFAELIQAPRELKLEPHTKRPYRFTLQMPAEVFSGLIAGGITFSEKTEPAAVTNQSGVAINNKFSYALAVLLRQQRETGPPDLRLIKSQIGQVNQRTVLQSTLQNPAAAYLNQLVCQLTLIKQGQTTAFYQGIQKNLQVAPNSRFQLTSFLNETGENKRVAPGKYQVVLEAYGQEAQEGPFYDPRTKKSYRYHWSLEDELTITSEKAQKLNTTDVTLKQEAPDPSLIYGLLTVFVLVVSRMVFRKSKR